MTEIANSLIDLNDGRESWLERVRIRHLRPADLPALEWEGEFQHFRRLYREVYKRMQSGLALMWVADLPPEGVIGQAFVQFESSSWPKLADGKKRAYVHSFRVRPAYRSAGLGSRIMETVEKDLYRRGFNTVTLNVSESNQGALRLYKRLKYQVVGKDPGSWTYVDDKGDIRQVNEPGWRMNKRLSKTD